MNKTTNKIYKPVEPSKHPLHPSENPDYKPCGSPDNYDAWSIEVNIPYAKLRDLQKQITLRKLEELNNMIFYESKDIPETVFLVVDKTVKPQYALIIDREGYEELGIITRLSGALGTKLQEKELQRQQHRMIFYRKD